MKALILAILLGFQVVANAVSISGTDLLTGQKLTPTSGVKGLVLVFLSAKCPCSNSHIPELKKLVQDFPQFQFVAVHANADEAVLSAKDYFSKQNLPFPVLQDEGTHLADIYKANKTPHAFVLSPEGEVLYRGGVTSSHNAQEADRFYLREALDDVDKGRPVRTKEARTLGCAIARKKI